MIFSSLFSSSQEGELFVGGVGVFAGYLDRDDLTAKVLVQINNEIFYRTGDLVRIDHNGLLHYISRKDFQIKLHGQRIELGEIERCLHNTSISACVVIKWGDDHLVAYVQSADINEKQLREHCQSHLPPHMIPSIFIVLKELPLNANGKIDRKCLPSPDLSSFLCHQQLNTMLLTITLNNVYTMSGVKRFVEVQEKFRRLQVSLVSVVIHSCLLNFIIAINHYLVLILVSSLLLCSFNSQLFFNMHNYFKQS